MFEKRHNNVIQSIEDLDCLEDFPCPEFSGDDANSQPTTDSLKVAKVFGKNHRNVLRDIKKLIKNGVHNFVETPYIHPQNGQKYSVFTMDRYGFTLLAMGFTGDKALKFKLDYIAAFNAMEAQLKAMTQIQKLEAVS